MATITITIPNPLLNRVIDAYAYQHGYQDEIPSASAEPGPSQDILIPNPETKNQFVRRMLVRHVKQAVRAYEGRIAEDTARQEAHSKVEAEINLTVT